jgi:TPR repeat protein
VPRFCSHCGLAIPLVHALVVVCLPFLLSQHAISHGSLPEDVERSDLAVTEVTVRNLSLPFIRWFSLAILMISFFLFPPLCNAFSTLQSRQSAAPSVDPSDGDAATQYKLACSLLLDARSAPDYPTAIRLLRSSASQHFAPAQFLLGYLYEHGRGVAVDYALAAENYRAAAGQGHAGAENNLGGLYQYGRGVPIDINQAFEWYRASAQHGNAMGQYNLGTFYRLGYATPPDFTRAAEWFLAAANQGLAAAEANLAIFYFKGMGVPIDNTQAAHWASLAAAQGLPHAAMNYAFLCEHGLGVPRNYYAAYIWYSRAAALGDNSGASHLKSLAHHLSRAQLDQANSQLAAEASHPQQPASAGAEGDLSLVENP